ncbi:MAG: nickel-dependent lactate racemase [bacterium]
MNLKISYGAKSESVSIPDQNLLSILRQPRISPSLSGPSLQLKNATRAAAEFLTGYHRILLLINDYTRPTRNQPILRLLIPELERREIKLIICLGTHRSATETELKRILGEPVFLRFKDSIIQHNCHDIKKHFFLGKTSFGTEVWVNRAIFWADALITINSIEPHYFAGYTGGRKAFLPGIAAYQTIIQNHNLLLHPASAPLSLKGNPVSEDMTEAARMVPRPIFSIQIVQDKNHRILSAHYGDLFKSFETAVACASQQFAVPIKEKADIVLSVLQPPYDINLYQSQRAVEFAIPALKPGGIQITVSSCHHGAGNDEFIQVLKTCTQPEQLLRTQKKEHPGWHKAARLAKIMQNARLYTVMPGVSQGLLRDIFMHPFDTVQDAIDNALTSLNKNATLYIIPDAGTLVPVV